MQNTALITGASFGIGKELAKIHASKGGDLVLVARSEDSLLEVKEELESKYSVNVKTIKKDLSNSMAASEIYEEVSKENIRISVLINNAGFGLRGEFDKMSLSRQEQMINLNILALTQLTHLFLQDFRKANNGKILNVSSTASFMPGPLQAVYFATKAYVTYFSNALSEELRDTNITVTNLMPGATETKFAKTSGMDKTKAFAKTASAFSVANDAYNGMLKGDIDVISGLTCSQNIMRYMIPFTPKKILLKEIKKIQEVG